MLATVVVWSANCAAFAQPGPGAGAAKGPAQGTPAGDKPDNLGTPDQAVEYHDPKTGNITAGPPIEAFLKQQLTPLPPEAPKPSADPRDFQGVWLHDQVGVMRINFDDEQQLVPFTKDGRRIADRRLKAGYSRTPYVNASLQCLPPGQPWELELNFPFRVFQTDKYLVFAFEEYHTIWNIQMSDRHKPDQPAQYMGDSIAHWDGNTLVVDTVNYKAGIWIDPQGTPMSAKGHLIQRIKRTDEGGPHLEITTIVDDKTLYSKPWSFTRTFAWRPDRAEFAEFNCERQATAPDGISRYGAVPEPLDDQ